MRTLARWRLIAPALATALLVAACGGGDLDAAAPGGPSTPTGGSTPTTSDDGTSADDGTEEPGASLSADLLGAGASFPNPLYQTVIGDFRDVEPGVSIQYESIGSGGGKNQLIGGLIDFGGTDSVMNDDEIADGLAERGCVADEVLHIPTVFGGVVIAYNISGVDELTLDSATIAGIFAGDITSLDDPAIAALNDGVDLPSTTLTPIVRADGSGTTSIFTTWLNDEDADWATNYGRGSEIDWFDGVVAGEQNDGVAAAVSAQPGAIGYLSLEFAVAAGLPFAQVVNADGNAVAPSSESVSAASAAVDLPDDLRFNVLGVGGDGYPIAGATWILAYTCGYDAGDADALKAFLEYLLVDGADHARELGYAPLGGSALDKALEKVSRINEEG